MAMGRPKKHVARKDVEHVVAALEIHGGLLPVELETLQYSPAEVQAEDTLLSKVETVIGPLYLSLLSRNTLDAKNGDNTPRRTVSATIDAAYLRLFIRRTPGEWEISTPQSLSTLLTDLDAMPTVKLGNATFYLCGKALGDGVTARSLRRYLADTCSLLRSQKRSLLIVSPNIGRYKSVSKLYPDLVQFSEYTLAQAAADNREQ